MIFINDHTTWIQYFIFITFTCIPSTSEQKGAECYEKFAEMQDCMKEYPTLYKEKDPMPDQKEVEAAEAASSLNASETVIENKQGDEQKKELTKSV